MKQNAKKILSILMVLCMVIGFLPPVAFASENPEDRFESKTVDVSADMASSLIALLTGEDPGEPVQTEDGYTFEMPDSMADTIASAVDEAAGGLDGADAPEDIPEDASPEEGGPEEAAPGEEFPEEGTEVPSEEGGPDAEPPFEEDGGDVSGEDPAEDAGWTDDNANDLPEDYVDDSNDALYQMLHDMTCAPVSSYYLERGGVSLAGKKIDLFFVIDSTGSMSSYITNVKNNVAAFAKAIGETGAILRLGLIDYRDITVDGSGSTRVHEPGYSPWMDVPGFITELTTVRASGGGDTPETPIDALAKLVQPGIGWNSDAYKFAMLITDAGYKTNNNYGVASMEEMTALLRERDIFVSSITPSGVMDAYGGLAGLTGGVQIPLSGSFADDMMDYAEEILKSVSVEAEAKRDYAVRVTDSATGLPLKGAKITWSGGSAVVDEAGTAIITAAGREDGAAPVTSVTIEMPGYKTVVLDSLFGDKDIEMVPLTVDEESEDAGKALTLTPSMFKNPKSGKGSFAPVEINFLGKNFDLLNNMGFSFNLPLFGGAGSGRASVDVLGGKLSINNDVEKKTFEVMFGYDWEGKEHDPDSSYWKEDYKKYKSLVQTFHKDKPAKDIYNDFRKLRKNNRTKSKADIMFPVDINAGGYAEVSYASGSLDMLEGGIVVGVSTKDITLIDFPIPPAPYIYFRLVFQMDLTGNFKLVKVDSAAQVLFEPKAVITATPNLTGTLNLGVPKLASVGGGLKGTLNTELNLPFKTLSEGLSVALEGNFVIKLKLLGFNKGFDFGKLGPLQLYPRSGRSGVLSLAEYGAEDFVPIGRPTPVYARAGGDFLYYQNKVFENSAPQLVQLTDGRWLMVWTDAAETRGDSSMAALYYSVTSASGEWSAPRMVDDDGTGDFTPSLTLAADGTPVAVWQNSKTAWTVQPGLEEAAADIEVKAAAFNTASNTFGTASAITSNTSYETSVQVVPEGTGAAAYWLETSAGDPLLASGTAEIAKSVWNGTAWSAPEHIASIDLTAGLNGFTAGTIAGTSYAAYAGESGIRYVSGTGGSGSISTDGESAGLQIVNGLMYWCDGSGLKSWDGSAASVESGEFHASEFTILDNGGSRAALMRESTGYANELFASVYNGGGWSEPVAVTDYDMSLTTASAALDASGRLCWACGRTEISEAGVFGGSDLVVDACTPGAKVVVGAQAHISSLAVPGEEADVSVELANMGLAPASGLSAMLSLNGGAPVPSPLYIIGENGDDSPLASIGAGETLWADAKYTLPALASAGTLTVDILGPDGTSCGTAAVEVPAAAADLEVSNVSAVRTEAGADITASVSNVGCAAAGNVAVNLTQEGVDAVQGTQTVAMLPAGGTETVTFSVSAENLSAASVYDYKRFTVEAEAAAGEAITGNNSDSAVLAPVLASSIVISGEKEISLKGGQKLSLACEAVPAGTVANLVWLSTNTSAATVEQGVVSAWGNGSADIIACHIDAGGREIARDTVKVTVTEGISTGVSGVSITPETLEVQIGRTGTLTAVVSPSTALDKSVEWYVDDRSVVELTESGEDNTVLVTGLAEGTATITVRTNDGAYTAAAQVEVVTHSTDTTPGGPFGDFLPSIMMRTYRITAPSRVAGGSVSLSPSRAMEGRTVTITAVPDAGYELDSLTVVTSSGVRLPVTDVGGDRYTFVMAGGNVAVNCVFTEIVQTPEESAPVFVPAPVQPKIPFVDVPSGAYCYDAVQWAVNKGIANGTGNYIFSPAAPCTRADIVTFLWRAAGSPSVNGVNAFTDVSDSAYYRDAVLWAAAAGITSGTGGNTFRPNDVCTRGQAMAFLYRYAGSPAVGGASGFADVDGSAYYAAAVSWAVANQITQGTGANRFSPDETCTRGHIVTFLYRDLA